MAFRARGFWLAAVALLGLLAAPAPAQEDDGQQLAPGKLLVASPELRDPNFAQTVVLIVKYGDSGSVGIVLNRQTKAPLARVFGLASGAPNAADPVYAGGPVEDNAALALLRAAAKPDGADRVFGDVYLVTTRSTLEKSVKDGVGASRLRVYLGYGGWGPGQLEAEREIGAWRVLTAKSDLAFDSDPASLWDRMRALTDTSIALFGGLASGR